MEKEPADAVVREEALRHQLEMLVNIRTGEGDLVFTVFGVFWPAHAVLLIALFSSGSVTTDWTVGVTVSLAGCFFSAVWFLLQRRLYKYMHMHEAAIRRAEADLKIPARFALFPKKRDTYASPFLKKGTLNIGAHTLLSMCALISGAAWGIAVFCFAF